MNDDPGTNERTAPTAACLRCDHQVSIDRKTCDRCGIDLVSRLEIQGTPPSCVTPLLWWGLFPPVIALAFLQLMTGQLLADLLRDPFVFADATGMIGLFGVAAFGPAIIAGGLMANAARARHLVGRHRLVAGCSLPITILALTPILGLLPALLAVERGPGSASSGDQERTTCPCGYRLPFAGHHERLRCPECGAVLAWSFRAHVTDRLLWLLGLIGAAGTWMLLPFTVAPLARYSLLLFFAVAVAVLMATLLLASVLRRGWDAVVRSRVPRAAWLLVGVVPLVSSTVFGLII